MSSVRIEIVSGAAAGRVLEPDGDVVRIGRAPTNDLQLPEPHVSAEHARLVIGSDRVVLEDLHSTNGSAVVRGHARIVLSEDVALGTTLQSGDRIELGGEGEESTALIVTLAPDADPPHVVAVRPIAQFAGATPSTERNTDALKTLYEVQKAVGATQQLDAVLAAVAGAALRLVPRATHATLILREQGEDESSTLAAYVPVLTRERGPGGAPTVPAGRVAVTRSIFRKVIEQQAALLVADAPLESFSSESLIAARVRSTVGVPLWRGEDILGVLQVDNRDAPSMFDAADVDTLSVLAANASLAVDNARLIQRLMAAEERLKKENTFLKGRERARRGEVQIVGESRVMQELLAQVDKVVDTRVTVLVEGETGTGKELIASAIHYRSRRRDKLFVAQNCAAMPENLLESELFGHKRGAFTGATEEKRGLFDIADGGTLFLDEVTELPVSLQAKLLRVLQDGEIRPVGGTSTKHVNVRIVTATNKHLEAEVSAGRFREDLYYRLKVFPLRVPPLRERREDIAQLASHFLQHYTREIGKPVAGIAQQTLDLLMAYDWPGNVRELENEIQRMVIQVDQDAFLTPALVSPRVRRLEGVIAQAGAAKGSLKEMVEQVEKYLLLEALREHNNNKTSAAKALGITREGLHKKLRHLGIA
jgi:transcriptional regulator with GAF, ATPase, and Fis domain